MKKNPKYPDNPDNSKENYIEAVNTIFELPCARGVFYV